MMAELNEKVVKWKSGEKVNGLKMNTSDNGGR